MVTRNGAAHIACALARVDAIAAKRVEHHRHVVDVAPFLYVIAQRHIDVESIGDVVIARSEGGIGIGVERVVKELVVRADRIGSAIGLLFNAQPFIRLRCDDHPPVHMQVIDARLPIVGIARFRRQPDLGADIALGTALILRAVAGGGRIGAHQRGGGGRADIGRARQWIAGERRRSAGAGAGRAGDTG
jgi:hypothetical protein